MGLFWAAHGWEGSKKAPLLKTCQPYPTMIKLGTVIPYLKKNQNIYKSTDAPLNFWCHQHLFHRKSAKLAISRKIDIEYIIMLNF